MKTILILICASILFSVETFAQTYKELVAHADTLYNLKDYNKSNEAYQQAFKLESNNPYDLYNAACSAALAGDLDDAFTFLDLAVHHGWTNIDHMKKDSDLDTLHSSAKWASLLASTQKKLDDIEAKIDKPLQKELLTIFDEDQTTRRQSLEYAKQYGFENATIDSLRKVTFYKDSINLVKVINILDRYGWVGQEKVGTQANQTIFLVIQHSDLTTQQKYLPIMRDAVRRGNAAASALALLEDRVALGEGRKQIYGSQIGRNQETNKYYVEPLEDPDNVDVRRSGVGLESLGNYVKRWDIVWSVEEYKKQLPQIEKWYREMIENNKSYWR